MSDAFLIFGHRGSPKRFPENTVRSFEEALRVGADGFETDLRLLADSTPVLFHDDEFEDAEVESHRFERCEIDGRRIERVSALAPFAGRTTMILEVKRGKWEDLLLEAIGTWPNIVVASFDHSLIAELHRRNVACPLGVTTTGFLVGAAAYTASIGATWYFPNFRLVDAALVSELHAKGIKVVPYTANRATDWSRLRSLGCDGVITDYPEEAVQWRAARNAERRTQNLE